jgi:hypothetical protein
LSARAPIDEGKKSYNIDSRSLQDILDYEGDVEEDLMLNFEVNFDVTKSFIF